MAEENIRDSVCLVLWAEHPELFSNEVGVWEIDSLFLLKIIDAKDDLSIRFIRMMHMPQPMKMVLWERQNAGTFWIVSRTPSIVIGHHAKIRKS